MSKSCNSKRATHHLACDCREAQVVKLVGAAEALYSRLCNMTMGDDAQHLRDLGEALVYFRKEKTK